MAGAIVSASTGAMGSLLGKLGAMLTDEYKLLKDVRGDIKFLKDELEVMNAFLLKMSDVEEPDEPTKLRVTTVWEMSYKIEDNIDKFMVLVEEHQSSCSGAHGIRKLIDKCNSLLPDIKTRHKIAKEVKNIKNQIKEVSDRFLRYKIDESSSMPAKDKVDPRLRALYKDATELVGIDGPRDELVKWLKEKEGESLRFVSIVGYGGLGKTTLANQIRASLLGTTFECGAFVSISRKPDMKAILRSILSQITKQDTAYSGLDDLQLIIEKIREVLQDRRYFIIIDDIWESGTWETLKCAFVKNSCGSRIMITTRIVDVAKSCSPSNEDLVYEMKPLSEADSKKLFFKRIFGCEESCPDNLKEASKDILKKCRGLPLAINAISSLLATTSETKEEWDRVRHSIRSSDAKNDIIETMNYILSLSYFDLPHHLRSCILYLALFHEDELIGRERLVRRWIYEGFILGKSGQDLMELGEEYFHQLVNRSLIQPENIGYDGKAWYCRVHDTILDFLIAKSSEENLCTVLTKKCKPDGIVRRISIMGTEDEDIVEQLDLSHARSIGAFEDIERLPSLGKSKSLRVLDLQRCRKLKNHHIKDIGRLYQLRYLDISFCGITELPRQIGELLYLETLNVIYSNVCKLSESTTRLRRLAGLFLSPGCKLPDGLGNLVNLQELHEIDALHLKHVEELGKLTNLRKLKIRLNTDKIERNTLVQSKEKLVSSLCKLDECGLRSLSISYYMGDKDGEEPFLPALDCIREVHVYVEDICRISRWLASLPNLHRLTFQNPKKIEQQDIDMIGLIPTLLELSLNFHGTDDARQLIIRCEGFQLLQRFEVYDACMGILMFEPGAMPRLKELEYSYFQEAAVNLDFGIQHLSSLARLRVGLFCLIGRERLVRRWIYEGFILGKSGQDLMELGEEYFHQLVNRSLIQPENIGYDGKAWYCRVHDTILDFLIAKSSEENLCTVLKKKCKPDGIVRRISIMGTEDEDIVEQLDLSQARSISAFGDIERLPSLGKSKSLRVLDLRNCSKLENHHIKDIGRLYQLRYLDISFTGITKLPMQIGELLYLETLVVTSYKLLELPESTNRLRRLARLFVSPDCKLPDGLGNLVNLQDLDCVDALQSKHVEELGKLTNLRKLKVRLNTDEIERNTLVQSKEKLVSSLCKLDKCGLRSLSISYQMGDKDGEEPFLPALGCIREVIVYTRDICQISRWLASLPNLHMLRFMDAKKIEQQDIDMIGLIPNLLELSLYLRRTDVARQLIIRCEGFQQLQRFEVLFSSMGVLMFEPGAMPRLKELMLRGFQGKPKSGAVNLDFGIQHLSSLARLRVSLFCDGSTAAEVKAAEDAFKSMAEANPNRPTLEMTRLFV